VTDGRPSVFPAALLPLSENREGQGFFTGEIDKPFRRDGILLRILEARIEECTRTVHLSRSYVCIPVRDGAKSSPGVEVNASKPKRWRNQCASSLAVWPLRDHRTATIRTDHFALIAYWS
jgi:hypothetical protein